MISSRAVSVAGFIVARIGKDRPFEMGQGGPCRCFPAAPKSPRAGPDAAGAVRPAFAAASEKGPPVRPRLSSGSEIHVSAGMLRERLQHVVLGPRKIAESVSHDKFVADRLLPEQIAGRPGPPFGVVQIVVHQPLLICLIDGRATRGPSGRLPRWRHDRSNCSRPDFQPLHLPDEIAEQIQQSGGRRQSGQNAPAARSAAGLRAIAG